MRLRQTSLSPLLRFFAALVLSGFVAGQIACTVHCNFGGMVRDSISSCCHSKPTPGSHGEASKSGSAIPSSSICITLKNQLTSNDALTLVIPEFGVLHFLTSYSLPLDVTATKRDLLFARQTNHGNWVCTPEVFLGPALHSLAPPSLAS